MYVYIYATRGRLRLHPQVPGAAPRRRAAGQAGEFFCSVVHFSAQFVILHFSSYLILLLSLSRARSLSFFCSAFERIRRLRESPQFSAKLPLALRRKSQTLIYIYIYIYIYIRLSLSLSLSLYMYIYIYILHIHIYIYIYIALEIP